jgi:PrsW family intramembrane metalloprotease
MTSQSSVRITARRKDQQQYPFRRVWRTAYLEAGLLLLITLAAVLIFRLLPRPLNETARRIFGLGFSFLPLLLWWYFSWRAERRSVQPREGLLTVLVLGALAASGVGLPLIQRVFTPDQWLTGIGGLDRWLGYTFTVGLTHEFLKYAVMRYGVFPRAFNTRLDSVALALATAVGYATVLNIDYVLSGDYLPTAMALRITEITLAQMAISPLMGVALYTLKLPFTGIFTLPGMLLIAALLNGLSVVLRSGLVVSGIAVGSTGNNATFGLGMGVFLVIVLFGVVRFVVNNADTRDTLRRTDYAD